MKCVFKLIFAAGTIYANVDMGGFVSELGFNGVPGLQPYIKNKVWVPYNLT